MRSNYSNEINESLFQERLKNNGHLPHRMEHDVVGSSSPNFPCTTRDFVNHNFTRHITRNEIKDINVSFINVNTDDRRDVANILASFLPKNASTSNRTK